MSIVLDNSAILAWCLADEDHPVAKAAMRQTMKDGAVVPGIWWYEIHNALIVNERRGRLTSADTHATLNDLKQLNIEIEYYHDAGVVLELARKHELSVYDAGYLELAQRRELVLASLDEKLCRAAEAAGVRLCGFS